MDAINGTLYRNLRTGGAGKNPRLRPIDWHRNNNSPRGVKITHQLERYCLVEGKNYTQLSLLRNKDLRHVWPQREGLDCKVEVGYE